MTNADASQPPPLRYRFLTGPDDRSFCERVSAALDEGYVLYGSPTLVVDGDRRIAAQAVILSASDSRPATSEGTTP